ncbi:helix-turn-helix domain-containing protein [Sediminitomix flava]|uniref:AraC-like DNA-binding protein n=1 Tax=Sediminitomix flava TaxID=379075 RepID=A0A315Z903_SEDFL|nr:AraC family transcriptional regulator [Sediminitomix flava]PWJ41772.1 AraC-like DNA-binding protein [Sediminitomix flava]
MDTFNLNFKEGMTINLVEGLLREFGGEFIDNYQYRYKKGKSKIEFDIYTFLGQFEILLIEFISDINFTTSRTSDDDPELIHVNLIKNGEINHFFEDKKEFLKADSRKRVLLHNGLFEINNFVPANTNVQTVGFRFSKKVFKEIMPEYIKELNDLFPENEGIAYHTALPAELINLLDEMFYLKNESLKPTPLILAKGIEILAKLFDSVINLRKEDDFNGLHIHDYQRLLEIRKKLVSSLDQKIVLSDLAKEFGVSVSKLKRDFKTLFNTSVYQYHLQVKMDEAMRRLKSGAYSILEISLDLGYETPSKFSQMFKKIKGVNPKEILPKK